jgi:L-iditol 2-dehydrogenase
MKAAVLHANEDLRYEEYPTPKPNEDEVLIRVRATGICGSDIPRVLSHGAHFFPIVLGHEFSGDVVETGANVTTVKVGDRVTAAPLLPCHACEDCQRGDYSQCKHYSFIGSRVQGSFAQYVKAPARNVVKFGEAVSYEQGAMFEPSTVALHGLLRVPYRGGEDVAVLGGGTIGLFTAQWARIFGARSVTVFDIDDERLALAKRLGADATVNTRAQDFIETAIDAWARFRLRLRDRRCGLHDETGVRAGREQGQRVLHRHAHAGPRAFPQASGEHAAQGIHAHGLLDEL